MTKTDDSLNTYFKRLKGGKNVIGEPSRVINQKMREHRREINETDL